MTQKLFETETLQIRVRSLRASIYVLIVNSCAQIFYIYPYSFVFLRSGVHFTFTVSVKSILHQLGNEIWQVFWTMSSAALEIINHE